MYPLLPTLTHAVRELAGLGGFLGRRSDGDPGVVTLCRGVSRLRDLLAAYRLALAVPLHTVGKE